MSNETRDYDLFVIGGGGSGGFTAATTAMKLGAKVAMAESGRLGGLCILAGCMPSKSMLHDAEQLWRSGQASPAKAAGVLARKRSVVDYLAGSREKTVAAKRDQGLTVLDGRARFTGPHTVEVNGREISAGHFVVATGSVESLPPLSGLEEAGYITSHSLMELEPLPDSLIVLGGGTLALEMAQYAVRMGVAVTIIQRSGHLLSKEDERVGQVLAEALAAEGVKVLTGCAVKRVETGSGQKTVVFDRDGAEASVSGREILVALGRRPASEGLGLEAAGVETGRRGEVVVNDEMRTSAGHIFAAGDVTGRLMVVNLAVLQGEVAGHNAAGREPRRVDETVLPRAVFTDPEFARVGRNRADCQRDGIEFVEAEYSLTDMGAARTYAETVRGFVAMRAEKGSGRILGAEMVAPHASLMIHDMAVAMTLGGTAAQVADIPYIHPCLAEATNLCAYRLARKLKKG